MALGLPLLLFVAFNGYPHVALADQDASREVSTHLPGADLSVYYCSR